MEKELSFEEKINNLEKIVKELENGDVALDDAINKFNEAIKLANSCNKTLEEATKTVNKVLNKEGNLEDFEKVDDKNMKILMISTDYPKKGSNIYTDLSVALKNRGHYIKVVVAEEKKKTEKTYLHKERNIDVLRVKTSIFEAEMLADSKFESFSE